LTVSIIVAGQPLPVVYCIVAVPGARLHTVPDDALANVATDVLLLLQVPPVIPSDKVVQPPSHTCVSPPIDDGAGFTVTVTFLVQPNPNEYVITVVPLAVGALQTCPVLPTTATNVLLLVQVPPVGLSDNNVH
jgi:hypothetical protein